MPILKDNCKHFNSCNSACCPKFEAYRKSSSLSTNTNLDNHQSVEAIELVMSDVPGKMDDPTFLDRTTTNNDSNRSLREEYSKTQNRNKYRKIILELMNQINEVLPVEFRYNEEMPKKDYKKLLKLDACVDIKEYTRWYLNNKILNPAHPSIKGFELWIFLDDIIVRQYLRCISENEKCNYDKQTTSKWADHDFEASNKNLAERLYGARERAASKNQ